MFNLVCVYVDEKIIEYKMVYLIISFYFSDEFKMCIEVMCIYIWVEYDVLLCLKL